MSVTLRHQQYSGLQMRAICGKVEQVSNLLAGQATNLLHVQAWSHTLENRYKRLC
jgi:hypothetical protein